MNRLVCPVMNEQMEGKYMEVVEWQWKNIHKGFGLSRSLPFPITSVLPIRVALDFLSAQDSAPCLTPLMFNHLYLGVYFKRE